MARVRETVAGCVALYFGLLPAWAQEQGLSCPTSDETPLEVRAAIEGCVGAARSNKGNFCGTPVAMACVPVGDAGAAAVPLLIQVLAEPEDDVTDHTARYELSRIAGLPLVDPIIRLDAEELSAWWSSNCRRDRQDWILDALESSDRQRTKLGLDELRRVRDPGYVDRLIPLLESDNEFLARRVLGALWTQFRSTAAIKKATVLMEQSPRRREVFVVQTVESRIEPLYPVVVSYLRRTLITGDLPNGLISAAGTLKLHDAVDVLETWDRNTEIKTSKEFLIRSLVELKGAAYEERLFYFMGRGSPRERREAAVGLGRVGDPTRALAPLLDQLRAVDRDASEGALWGLDYLVERMLDVQALERIAIELLARVRRDGSSTFSGAARVLGDVASAYLKRVGRTAVSWPRPHGYPADPGPLVSDWEAWWQREGNPQSNEPSKP
jgi:HEAT repeat protein